MALAFTNKLAAGDAANSASYAAFGAISGTVGRLYLVHLLWWTATTKATITPTIDGGGTVDLITGSDSISNSGITSYAFRYRATATSHNLTMAGSQAALRAAVIVDEVTGEDPSGTNGSGAVVQAKPATGTGTNPLVTLDSAIANPNNEIWGGEGSNTNPANLAPTATWTQIGELAAQLESALVTGTLHKLNSQTASWVTNSAAWAASAVEIRAATAFKPHMATLL